MEVGEASDSRLGGMVMVNHVQYNIKQATPVSQ